MRKTTFANIDISKATGWTLGFRGGRMVHIAGCSRDTAIGIAKRDDATWCRPHIETPKRRVVNLPQ